MRGRLGMNTESPMHIMHLPSSRAFNSRGYRQILWYAPSTMVLVRALGQYRTPRYFDVAHTEDHRVPYALVASCTEHHGIWTSATPWCPVEYRVCCGLGFKDLLLRVGKSKKPLWVIIIGPSAPRTRRPSCSVLESGVASRRDFVKCSERSSTPPIAAEPSFQATRGAEGTQGALPFDAQAWACCTPPRRSTSLDLQKISDKSAIKAATLSPLPANRRSHCR